MKIKKQFTLVALFFATLFLLAACGGNKINGSWVQYSERTEKDKIVWNVDSKKNKLTVTNYSNEEKDDSAIIIIQLDKNKDVLSQTRSNGQIDDLPFSIEQDTLTIHDQTFYRDGSKADKKAKEKAKKARQNIEEQTKKNTEAAKVQNKKETEKQEKLKADEEEYNNSLDKLQERINVDFKTNYSGEWYSGKGFDEKNTAVYQSESSTKMTFKDDELSMQSSFVTIGDGHESNKEDVKKYDFVGIKLQHSYEYTEPEEDQVYTSNNVALPKTVKEIEEIKTFSDIVEYQLKNDVKELYFKCQSTEYKGSDLSLVLNLYNLEELNTSGATNKSSFVKKIPNKIEASDFDI